MYRLFKRKQPSKYSSSMALFEHSFMYPTSAPTPTPIQNDFPLISSLGSTQLMTPYIEQWNRINRGNENFSFQSQISCRHHGRDIVTKCICCQRILIIFKYSQNSKVCYLHTKSSLLCLFHVLLSSLNLYLI